MSAQAGIWNIDKKPVSRSLIARLSQSLQNSGPDGESICNAGEIALVYRPYHTTPESVREHQPYRSEDGCMLTFDGRIDNRDELFSLLNLRMDPNCGDVELVAAAFVRWRLDSFRKLVGDWALSIWDAARQELILAVDYLAVRHIYYRLDPESICWSSVIGALLSVSTLPLNLSDEYVAGYFANEPESHLTPYQEIRQLPAGHFLCVRTPENPRPVRYWSIDARSKVTYKIDSEYEEHFRHLFRRSVARRMRCQGSVLAEFSGGIDSSSIVCMADHIMAHEGAQARAVETLSYENEREPNGEDARYRKIIEERRGKVGAYILVTDPDSTQCLEEYPPELVIPGYLPFTLRLEKERARIVASGGYRVVLSGIGGDEFMGGISNAAAQLADLIMQFRLIALPSELSRWSVSRRMPCVRLFLDSLLELAPATLSRHLLDQAKIEDWIDPYFARRMKIAEKQLDVSEHFGLWLRSRRSYAGGLLLMANKMAKWQPPSAALEETRFPYLDQDLIEFILSIPASQLSRPGQRRSLMRRSLQGIVPPELLARKTKQLATRAPIVALERHWEQISNLARHFYIADSGFIDLPKFVTSLKLARAGQRVHMPRLLRTLSLELWLRSMINRGVIQMPRTVERVRRQRSIGQMERSSQLQVLHRS